MLVKMFKGIVISALLKFLNKPETKQLWVEKINNKIDLPGLEEVEEGKLIQAVLDKGFDEVINLVKGF